MREGPRRAGGAPVGIGRARGDDADGELLHPQQADALREPHVRPVAFGTSARSADLTDWPAGGYIGIHGTDRPELLPGARVARLHPHAQRRHPPAGASHAVGTPVTVRA